MRACPTAALLSALLLPAMGAEFTQPWPQQVTAPAPAMGQPPAQEICYDTAHFRIFSPVLLSPATQETLARLLEGSYAAVAALPLSPVCDRVARHYTGYKYPIVLYRTREDFQRVMPPGYAGATGAYHQGAVLLPLPGLGLRAEGENALPLEGRTLDSDTLTHELVHLLTLRSTYWDTPSWFGEGIAEYIRLAGDGRGNFNFAAVKEAIAPYVITGRKLGRELVLPPLEQVMNMQRAEFQQARGRAGQLNYAVATLLTYYFIHLDGKGDGARLKLWYEQLQSTPKATAHLRFNPPPQATPEQVAAERARLMQEVLATQEHYYYAPLLGGRSWQELEAELSCKLQQALGIRIRFQLPAPR